MNRLNDKVMQELIGNVDDATEKLREAQTNVHKAKYNLIEQLVCDNAIDCLSVNMDRVRRFYK